ncbi:FMN-binding protein [Candidatus Clostridium stratigraminis]|uniref:FMN-binding protein n=1 Tax=Candidatus Clostridium stratigraminis TaxID=3381661 RepID=A0ABW8SZP7_9CLOT
MITFLDTGFAKIATFIALLLTIIYFLRVGNKKFFNNKNKILKDINKALRKYHKVMGIILIIMGLIHGIFSSESIFSFNLGTASLILSILLGLSFMLRSKFKNKSWMYYHRALTVLFSVVLILHIAIAKEDSSRSSDIESFNNNAVNAQMTDAQYKDGTYTGQATGYRPGLEVSVTVKNNKIENIDIINSNDTPRFFNRAASAVPNEIIDNQSVQVDAVSRATRSSNGIMAAVSDALSKAVE